MKIYETPFSKEVLAQDFAFPALAQSGVDFTLVLGQCDGGPTTAVEGGQLESCFSGNPTGQSNSFQCAETGSTEYVMSISSAVAGSLACGSADSAFIVQITISGDVPSVCTVTSSINSNLCDKCNNTPESLGNGNCNDGIDNDCDGDADANDFNCAG